MSNLALNDSLSGAPITMIEPEGEIERIILLYPPNFMMFDSFKFFVDGIRERSLSCSYPQYSISAPAALYYESLSPEDQAKWPMLMVPSGDESIAAFLLRAFGRDISAISKMLMTSEGRFSDVMENNHFAGEELCRIFIGSEAKSVQIEGEETKIPGLSLCEEFMGMVIPEVIEAEATSTYTNEKEHPVHIELLAQLCNAFEGTGPDAWWSFTVPFASQFLDATVDIRRKQKEAMDKEKDGHTEVAGDRALETAYIDIDEAQNTISDDDELIFDIPGVEIPD
jgi:hypothetical protein